MEKQSSKSKYTNINLNSGASVTIELTPPPKPIEYRVNHGTVVENLPLHDIGVWGSYKVSYSSALLANVPFLIEVRNKVHAHISTRSTHAVIVENFGVMGNALIQIDVDDAHRNMSKHVGGFIPVRTLRQFGIVDNIDALPRIQQLKVKGN